MPRQCKYILTEEEAKVLEFRKQGYTQAQIGLKLNIAHTRVSLLEKRAYRKLGFSEYVYNAYKERSLEEDMNIQKIYDSIAYCQAHIKTREEKLDRLKKMQAPCNLINSEVNLLNRDKLNLRCLVFASNAYNQGVKDGGKKNV